jgi:ABC-type microcin C transport system duplicated ATPase subunit YejF
MTAAATTPVLDVQGLRKHFPIQRGLLRRTVAEVTAVDGVSFAIGPGAASRPSASWSCVSSSRPRAA